MISPPGIPVANRTVLVVDDDPAVRGSLQFYLEIEGYHVKTYSSGRDLLDDSDIPVAGCLVIDYRLPDINGLELLAELRRRDVSLPAILVTTHPSIAVRKQAEAAGAELVEKPLLNEALFERISAFMHA